MNPSLLVTLADKNYVNYAKQLFSSVYWNAGWKGDYMLLAHEIPAEDLAWFRNKGILVKECAPINMKKLAGTFPLSALNKLYLFTPEFKKWNNIIFLDPDIIVRSSLDKIAKVKGFNAVQDGLKLGRLRHQLNFHDDPNLFRQFKKKFKLRAPALNSGVLAFSTDIITDTLFEDLLRTGKEYEEICTHAEQTVLSLFFYKKWKKLSFLYNFIIPIIVVVYRQRIESFNPVVIHCCDKPKPWSPQSQLYKEWLANMEKSELIDLTKRPDGIPNHLFRLKIIWYSLKFTFIKYNTLLQDRLRNLKNSIDKDIGRIGIILKNKYPSLFYQLQNVLLKKK